MWGEGVAWGPRGLRRLALRSPQVQPGFVKGVAPDPTCGEGHVSVKVSPVFLAQLLRDRPQRTLFSLPCLGARHAGGLSACHRRG